MILLVAALFSNAQTTVATVDKPAYTKYLAYCNVKVPYNELQYGRTTYDHITYVDGQKPYYFKNIADTIWFPIDPIDYMENSAVKTIKPSIKFEDSFLNGSLLMEEVLDKYGSPRFKRIVTEVQKCLIALKYPVVADGVYNAATAKAVSQFMATYMSLSVNTLVSNYKYLTYEVLNGLKNNASAAGMDVSDLCMGKKNVHISRQKTTMVYQRRSTVKDFYDNGFNIKFK